MLLQGSSEIRAK